MYFNRYTVLVPLFVILASATIFAVRFDVVSYGQHGLSFNILHALADDDGGDTGGGDSGGDTGDGSGGDAGDTGGTGGDIGGGGEDGGGCCGGDSGGDTGGDIDSGSDTTPPVIITPSIVIPPTFTLSLNKTELSPGAGVTVHPGDTISYRVFFGNTGTGAQTNVTVTDGIPTHTTLSWQGGGTDAGHGQVGSNLWWLEGDISASTLGFYVDFTTTVNADAPDGSQICNTATIASDQVAAFNSNQVCNPVSNPTPTGSVSLTSAQVCSPDTLGVVTVTASATGAFSVHTDSPTGPLFASNNGTTIVQATGDWVTNGQIFFLIDDTTGATLDTATAVVAQRDCSMPTPVWTTYCTSASDANPWQWWQYDNSNPVNYRFLRAGDGTCVAPVVTSPAPVCTLTASPTSITSGGTSVLSWTTTYGSTFSINQGIGNVTPVASGSTTTPALTANTTYTGTVTSASGATAICAAAVTITTVTPPTTLACTLTVSPTSIVASGNARLTWTTTGATSFIIDQGIGTMTPMTAGTFNVSPTSSMTFTGTATAANGATVICSAALTTTGGGGGGGGGGSGGSVAGASTVAPVVTLFSAPISTPGYVYLSQIPATGLALGPVGTVLYWIALVAWSLALTYLVLFGAVPFLRRRFEGFGARVAEALNATAPRVDLATWPPVPMSAPAREPASRVMASAAQAAPTSAAYSPYDGFKSFAQEGALTIDDIVKGLSKMPVNYRPFAEAPVAPAPHTEPIYDHVEPIREPVAAFAPVALATTAPAGGHVPPTEVPTFIEAILAGNREHAFGMLREVVHSGGDAEAFLTQVACALDDAYRARLEGIPVHAEIKRITDSVATPVLERVVTAFASAVDSSYSVGITGAKLALTRALATLGA